MRRALHLGVAVLAVLATAGIARAEGLAGLLGVLQPGARPALALGGDPFRSPLADGSGWWEHPALTSPDGQRVEAEWGAPVRGASSAQGRSLEWWGTHSFSWRGRELRAAAGANQLDRSGQLGGDAGDVRLDVSGARVDAAARVNGVLPGLSLQATGPLWSEPGSARPRGAGLGARWAPRGPLAAQAHWESVEAPENFASNLRGEPISASLNLATERWQADAGAALPGALALEASVSRSRFRPLVGRSLALDYQLEPAGTAGVEQVSASLGNAPWRALARWSHVRFDAEGDVRWGGERFGHLTYARGEEQTWLVGAERVTARGRLLADAEVGELTAGARGTLETWPFTDAMVDLLGIRQVGRAEASARWLRLHVAGGRAIARAWRVSGGASWYDADLEGRVDTWRPTFLAFGVSDFVSEPLPWRRAQLAVVSGGVEWRGRGLGASLELQQPVYGRAFDIPRPPAVGGGTGDPGVGDRGGSGLSLRESGTELRIVVTTAR